MSHWGISNPSRRGDHCRIRRPVTMVRQVWARGRDRVCALSASLRPRRVRSQFRTCLSRNNRRSRGRCRRGNRSGSASACRIDAMEANLEDVRGSGLESPRFRPPRDHAPPQLNGPARPPHAEPEPFPLPEHPAGASPFLFEIPPRHARQSNYSDGSPKRMPCSDPLAKT